MKEYWGKIGIGLAAFGYEVGFGNNGKFKVERNRKNFISL